MAKNSSFLDINIGFNNKLITNIYNTKFLGIVTESTLSWKANINQILPKLRSACYAIRSY